MSSNIKIVAIGGNIDDRKLRCAAAKEIAPEFDHFYLSAGSPQNFPIKTNKALLKYVNKPVIELKKLDCGPNDTVVIIGNTNFDKRNFEKLIEGINSKAKIIIQGPGFNMIPTNLSSFSSNHENIIVIPATDCPSYPMSSIKKLIETYKNVGDMDSLQKSALAQFWLTRFDGSFYRQFGLSNIDKEVLSILEVSVANNFVKAIKDSNNSELKKTANNILETLSIKTDFKYNIDKQGTEYPSGAFVVWNELMELSSFKNGDESLGWLNILSGAILQSIKMFKNVDIKEYDGFVISTLLNKNIKPSREEHLKNMFNAMTVEKVPNKFSKTLKKITDSGKLWVLHDLGMDPICDDGIAIKILQSSFKEIDSFCKII